MDFFKKRFRKVGLKGMFRKKKKSKFENCVNKVIEARRSGCIDDQGNIIAPPGSRKTSKDKDQLKQQRHLFIKELEKQLKHEQMKRRPPRVHLTTLILCQKKMTARRVMPPPVNSKTLNLTQHCTWSEIERLDYQIIAFLVDMIPKS